MSDQVEVTTQEVVETPAVETTETFDREYVEKLRQENARYRTAAKKAQEDAEVKVKEAERAKMDELEKQKAVNGDLQKQLEAEKQARTTAERIASLKGLVADTNAAIKLLSDDHINEDGTINVDSFLEAYPFMKPAEPDKGVKGGGGSIRTKNTMNDQIAAAKKAGDYGLLAQLRAQQQLKP